MIDRKANRDFGLPFQFFILHLSIFSYSFTNDILFTPKRDWTFAKSCIFVRLENRYFIFCKALKNSIL